MDWQYKEAVARQFSAFTNKNGNDTVGVRLDDGSAVHLSLNGEAKGITRQKLTGYGVTREHFGKRLNGEAGIPVTIREAVQDDGTIVRELASPAVADDKVLDQIF